MPTFNNREIGSSVRAKINSAIERIDDLETTQAVTPQMYGALGNDTGDDTAALQAAIDACKAAGTTDGSGGKRLYIPPGTYRHTGLTVDRPITIEGAGGRRTRLRKIGNSTAPSVMIAPAHDGVDYVASTSLFANIKIKGIHLIGAGKDNIGGADGWRIQNATTNPIYTEVVLEDISAWAHAGNGLKGQTFAGPVRIYDINMSNNNLCGAEINSCVDWRIFGGEMGSNTLDSLQIAGCVQMRIYGLYVYSGGRFTANLFNSQIMWHGGAIDASATHGLNYDCRREFDYNKLIDVDFRKNGFNSSPNTYADIYVSSLATSELYLQNCGFEYPNNGSSLYNIQFQGSGNYVYEAGSRFEGGDVNAANVTNAPGQLRSVGRHMYSKGDRNYATLATDVVSNEQYTGLRLTNDFVPVVALYGTTGANAGGVLDIYQPDGIAVGQRIAAPGTGVPSLLNLPGPYDDDTAATAGGVTSGCAYRQTGGGVAYVGGGATGGSINANTVYASRSAAIAATIPATQNSLRLYHLGVLLEYKREAGVISNPALTTNGGAVYWSPAGKAYAEHYGSGAAAIAAMQADKGRVGFLTGFAVTSDVTIDGDGVSFSDGAYLDVSSGATVTIRCPIKSRRQWIFRGDGAISLTHSGAGGPGENARQYHVSWFGAFPSSVSPATSAEAAIQRGFDAVGNSREAVARFDMGNYWMRGGCDAPRGLRIVGQDRRRTVFLLDGDGWDAFTTLGVAVKIEKCQVEQPVGSTPRESAFFVVNHADCEVRSFRGGYADKNFVVNASGFSAIDTYFVYDSDRGAGSSCFQLTENAAHCTIDQVDLRSSAFGVEAIVRADVPSGSLSKLQVSNIKAITETIPVWLRATGGGVIQSFAVRDIVWDYSGGLGAVCPAMVKLETEDTAEIRVGNVFGLIGSNAVEYGVSIVQEAGGSVRDIVFSGLNIGGTGYVFDRQNDLGFSARLDVSGINLNNRELVIGGIGGLMTALPAPVYMDGQVLNAVPFGSRAAAIASTLSAHITQLSYISAGGRKLKFVEDAATSYPALTTNAGARKWVPAGDVFSLDAYGVVYDSPSTDNTTAVNTAWQFSAATGRKCLGRAGTIWHGGTLIARGGMDLGSTVYGKTVFKKQAGFNGRQLISEGFDTYTGTDAADTCPADITISSGIRFDGNWMLNDWFSATNSYVNTSGGGVFLYARRYEIDIDIINQAGIGFWSELNGDETSLSDRKKARVRLHVGVTKDEGIIFKGPSDITISEMWCFASGTHILADRNTSTTPRVSPTYGAENGGITDGIVFDGKGAEINAIHSWAHHSGGGIWTKGKPRIHCELLISESSAIGPRIMDEAYGHIGHARIHNNKGGWSGLTPGLWPDFKISTTEGFIVNSFWIKPSTNGGDKAQDRLVVDGVNIQVHGGRIEGAGYPGHGVVLSGNYNDVKASVISCKGTPANGDGISYALKRIAPFSDRTLTANITASDCDGYFLSSGTPNQERIEMLFRGSTGQVPFSGDAINASNAQRWNIYGEINNVRVMSETTVDVLFNSSITTEQTLTVAHLLLHAPSVRNIMLSIWDSATNSQISGTDAVQYCYVSAVDATNITIKVKMAVAHATDTAPRVSASVRI